MKIDLKKIDHKKAGFFRFRRLGAKFLLTNEEGSYAFLDEADFKKFLEGKLEEDSLVCRKLSAGNFFKGQLKSGPAVTKYRSKRLAISGGPSLHILAITQRCNHRCVYCHASAWGMEKKNADMDVQTAGWALDMIFQTPSPFIAIEFQGGEPLVNWPVVEFVVRQAARKNKKAGKELDLRLVSNFSLMTEDKYKFLIKNKVSLCTSLDGPEELHDKNRIFSGGSHKHAIKWLKRFAKDYPGLSKNKKYIWRAGALITISRFSLGYAKEIVDEYLGAGMTNIFLRPLNPFGFSKAAWSKIGYGADEFIEFYQEAMDYIIELNLQGKKFEEKFSKVFLIKILTDGDMNMMDYRSPCGAGLGQVAYNFNGDVYTCDEGRMLGMMGDESFKLGNVAQNTYEEMIGGPVVKTMCLASCLTGLAGCSDCAFLPYCGVCPVYNYFEQGNIFGQMPGNDRCKISRAVLDYLFEKLQDEKVKKIFEGWV